LDPITLIVTALVQGAAKAATDVVPDAYKGLRELLRKRFAGKPAAELVLEEHASDPQTYEAPLRKQLEQAALAEDAEVLTMARQLLAQLGAPAAPAIEIGRGARGIIGQTVTNATIVGDIH
jgi:hypothetical protein